MKHACLFLVAVSLSLPDLAAAQMHPLPRPENCTVQPVIVGDSNGMLIGSGYRVIVRDSQNRPIEGTQVSVNFQQGVFPYEQQEPGTSVACATRIISRVSDVNGLVVFAPRLGGFVNAAVMAVKGDGVFLATIAGRSTDLDASGATDVNDLNLFRQNYFNNPSAPETDFDQSGATDVGDLAIFRQVYFNDLPGVVCH